MESKKILGENIKRHRLFRGLSQEQLAEKADLSTQVISKIERGVENVAIDNLIAIAKALDFTLEELVCQDSDKYILKIVLSKDNAATIKNALTELGKVIQANDRT
ncbi:MAG: helix-turn-helix domain-containing protein [Candidatus Aminicenantales bacterium]